MSEEVIVRYCSPTLAGLKTGSLFSCPYQSRGEVLDFLRERNAALRKKGLRLLPLRLQDGKALIYVYRPGSLQSDLQRGEAKKLLRERGYRTESGEKCVARLMRRLRACKEFPHEIGLFLGYPCEDVRGFIENKAACAKCAGCWKVYGDEDKARRLFHQYKKCTGVYQKQWQSGKPLSKLAVAK